MAYCTECGTEVAADAKFCPECGNDLDEPGETTSTEAEAEATDRSDLDDTVTADESIDEAVENDEGIDYKLATASVLMAILVGAIVAFAFSNIGGSSILFFVTLAGVTYYLYDRKSSARSAIGSGLYIFALWLPITPILFYIPVIGGAEEGTAQGAGQAVGGILGLFIWGFVFFLIGLVVFAAGYFVNRGVEE